MRHILILAAAASLAMACHNRSEDEVGAAPDRGDTTAVAADTTQAAATDTTMGQAPAASDSSYVAQDSSAAAPTTGVDSVGAQGQVQTGDSTGAWTDTTGAATPADTTMKQ
jgi:hypothetical protein